MTVKRRKGVFIVFEGPDRTGKSTQAKLLISWLKSLGRVVIHTREPGGTPFAEGIRAILLDPAHTVAPVAELLLYEAGRAQHTQEKILPELERGNVVISERYAMSSLAYQAYGRGIPYKTVKQLNDIATSGLQPDLTVVFDMPDARFDARKRAEKADRLELEAAEFRARVRKGYRELAKKQDKTILLDADRPVDAIQKELRSILGKAGIKKWR